MNNLEQIAIELYGKNYKTVIAKATRIKTSEIRQELTNKAFQLVRGELDSGIEMKEKLSKVKKEVSDFMNICRG